MTSDNNNKAQVPPPGSVVVADWHRCKDSKEYFSKILHKKRRKNFGMTKKHFGWITVVFKHSYMYSVTRLGLYNKVFHYICVTKKIFLGSSTNVWGINVHFLLLIQYHYQKRCPPSEPPMLLFVEPRHSEYFKDKMLVLSLGLLDAERAGSICKHLIKSSFE